MWDALTNLYENKNENMKMALRESSTTLGWPRERVWPPISPRLRQVKDELAVVGEIILDSELVRIALKGFTKEWDVFVKCVVGREKLPDWSRLWDEFTQEDIQEGSQSRDQEKAEGGVDEYNVSLVGKRKDKKKDMSKVK
jgi:hypothetical protein